jgi:hypothetical protein
MCWSADVSLLTFGIVSVVSAAMVRRGAPNDILFACFVFGYGLMQLFEFMIWMGQPCHVLNTIGSILACLLLYSHVLFIAIGFRYDKGYKKTMDKKTKDFLLFIGLLVIVLGAYRMTSTRHKY